MTKARAAREREIVLRKAAQLARARGGMLNFIRYTMPTFEISHHHRVIAQHLNKLIRGDINRLIITMPPRHGKSQMVSIHFPAFLLGLQPTAQIISASYNATLAAKMNRSVQRVIDSPAYREVFPGTQLSSKAIRSTARGNWLRNTDEFEVVGHGGFYRSAGVGGSATGYGATCVTGSTKVATEDGQVEIEALFAQSKWPKVWGYNHTTGRRQLCRIKAMSKSRTTELCTFKFSTGGSLTCTPNHLLWTQGAGYRSAQDCHSAFVSDGYRQGDQEFMVLSPLSYGLQQDQKPLPQMHGLLAQGCGSNKVLPVCKDQRNRLGRLPQVGEEGQKSRLLLKTVCCSATQFNARRSKDLLALRQTAATNKYKRVYVRKVLHKVLPNACSCGTQKTCSHQKVLHVQKTLPIQDGGQILFDAVQEQSAQSADGRQVKSSLPGRQEHCRCSVCQDLQEVSAIRKGKGQAQMCLLQSCLQRLQGTRAPYRRKQKQQPFNQPDTCLRQLPFKQAQVTYTYAEDIKRFSCVEAEVYDLQVEDCHNYYANQILTHNCGIIDDPTKNRDEANSVIYQERNWDWYTSTFYSRLEKGGKLLVVATRWHQRDLIGRLLAQAEADKKADQWTVLNMPAICETEGLPHDPRKVGEPLWANKYGVERLAAIKAVVGSRDWTSLYQQRPSPEGGGVVKEEWWQFYERLPEGLTDHTISVDLSFKDRGDFSAFQVWAAKGADRFLCDQYHGRMTFTQQIKVLLALCRKWPMAATKLVEDAANGAALIDTLKHEVQGLVPIRATQSKELRVDAVSPQIEAGNVYLPSRRIAPWVDSFVSEFNFFPNGANDDMVDACSQALFYMRQQHFDYNFLAQGVHKQSQWL